MADIKDSDEGSEALDAILEALTETFNVDMLNVRIAEEWSEHLTDEDVDAIYAFIKEHPVGIKLVQVAPVLSEAVETARIAWAREVGGAVALHAKKG